MTMVTKMQKLWRPLAGMFCALALGWIFILAPLLNWIAALLKIAAVIPEPNGETVALLITCLGGLGILRTTEKIKTNNTQDAEASKKSGDDNAAG